MILAQIDPWAQSLAGSGVLGVVLLWFMLRNEGLLKELRESNELLTKAHLLSVVANREASQVVREQAEQMTKQLEDRISKRRR